MPQDHSQDPTWTLPPSDLSATSPLEETAATSTHVSSGGSGPSACIGVWPLIAGYEITSEIARGGMGCVYAARDLTLDRQVAIKTLLPGAKADRFITESKITARLPHPGIPPVHALGTLPDGSPYLAMKLICGRTLAELLQERPTPQDDLARWVQVFEQIAQAVGFAHAQGIIHRDLKPLNVMVGAFGEVQVMDWGLAKDTTLSSASTSPEQVSGQETSGGPGNHTVAGAIMGTPAYMAPEQARGETVDARADVFALGAILAVILTGQPAIVGNSAMETILKAGAADLTEGYSRLEESGADPELIALARWCLAADAADRPADARVVASEVAAYRAGVESRLRQAETARALAETQAVEQKKRRRLAQWAGGLIAAALLLGLIGLSIGLLRAGQSAEAEREARVFAQGETEKARTAALQEKAARDLADAARSQAELAAGKEKLAREQAEQERAIALAVRDFLQSRMLRKVNPWEQANRPSGKRSGNEQERPPLTVRELLDSASLEFAPESIATKFPNQPLVQAEILETIGDTYEGLHQFNTAVRFTKAAHQLREKHLGRMHPATLTSLVTLGFVHLAASQPADAITLFASLVDRLETLVRELPDPAETGGGIPENHAAVLAFSGVLKTIEQRLDTRRYTTPAFSVGFADGAVILLTLGNGLPQMERLADICVQRFGKEDRRTLLAQLLLAFCCHGLGQVKRACDSYEALYSLAEKKYGTDDWVTIGMREVLMVTYASLSTNPDKQRQLLEENVQSKRRVLGDDHPSTLYTLASLAVAQRKAGKLSEATTLLEKVHQAESKSLGAAHPSTLETAGVLADYYWDAGKQSQSISLNEQIRDAQTKNLGPDHLATLNSLHILADAYLATGKTSQAIPLFEQAREGRLKKLGVQHPDTLRTTQRLAEAYRAAGRSTAVIPLYEQLRDAQLKNPGLDHPDTQLTLKRLAEAYRLAGKPTQAIDVYEQVRQVQTRILGQDHHETLVTMNNQGVAYLDAKRFPEAIALFEQVRDLRIKKSGPQETETITVLLNLGTAYRDAGRPDESMSTFEQAALGVEAGRFKHPYTRTIIPSTIRALETAKKWDVAEGWRRKWMAFLKEQPGNDSFTHTTQLAELSLNLLQQKKWSEAEPFLRECLQLREKNSPTTWGTFNTHSMLGGALLGQKKFAEAEPLLLRGYEGMKARETLIPLLARDRLREAVDRLIELYTATDRPEEVQKWEAERSRLKPAPQTSPPGK